MGHIACSSLRAPKGTALLEVSDTARRGQPEDLRRFLDFYFPLAARFRLVWRRLPPSPLYVWEPVPPSEDFVAVGMVAATEEGEPSVEVRCVPRLWAERLTERERAVKVWADAGVGGSPAGFWAPMTAVQRGAAVNASEVLFSVSAGTTAQSAPEMHFLPAQAFRADLPPSGASV